MNYHKSLLSISASFLLWISFPTLGLTSPHTPKVSQAKIWHVQANRKQVQQVQTMMLYETQEILSNIHDLAGLTSYQLPSEYYYVYFPQPVIPSPFSPVRHPITEMIITVPKHRWDRHRLLIQNPNHQWLEYRTTRSLLILLKQIQAWNPN